MMLARTRSRNLPRARDPRGPRHSLSGDAARPVGSSGCQGFKCTRNTRIALANHPFDDIRRNSLQPTGSSCHEAERGQTVQSSRAAVRVKMEPGHGTLAEDWLAAAGRGQFAAQILFRFRTRERSQANGQRPRLLKPAPFKALRALDQEDRYPAACRSTDLAQPAGRPRRRW